MRTRLMLMAYKHRKVFSITVDEQTKEKNISDGRYKKPLRSNSFEANLCILLWSESIPLRMKEPADCVGNNYQKKKSGSMSLIAFDRCEMKKNYLRNSVQPFTNMKSVIAKDRVSSILQELVEVVSSVVPSQTYWNGFYLNCVFYIVDCKTDIIPNSI